MGSTASDGDDPHQRSLKWCFSPYCATTVEATHPTREWSNDLYRPGSTPSTLDKWRSYTTAHPLRASRTICDPACARWPWAPVLGLTVSVWRHQSTISTRRGGRTGSPAPTRPRSIETSADAPAITMTAPRWAWVERSGAEAPYTSCWRRRA